MPKTTHTNTRFAPGTIEHIPVTPSRTERVALFAILFLLFMCAGFCLASLLGYIEMREVLF